MVSCSVFQFILHHFNGLFTLLQRHMNDNCEGFCCRNAGRHGRSPDPDVAKHSSECIVTISIKTWQYQSFGILLLKSECGARMGRHVECYSRCYVTSIVPLNNGNYLLIWRKTPSNLAYGRVITFHRFMWIQLLMHALYAMLVCSSLHLVPVYSLVMQNRHQNSSLGTPWLKNLDDGHSVWPFLRNDLTGSMRLIFYCMMTPW